MGLHDVMHAPHAILGNRSQSEHQSGHHPLRNLIARQKAQVGTQYPLSWGDAIFGVISTEISAQPLYTPLRRPVVTSQNNSFPSHERLAPLSQTAYRAAAAHML